MSTYAIGDLQGCFSSFERLLDKINFNSQSDRLWLVGDLVNRGPDSLATLRFVRSLGESATVVLGNHDLHLLMLAEKHTHVRRLDTLDEVLAADDCAEILSWLRGRKLMHIEGGYGMVHAGLLPSWSIEQATELAQEVEHELRSVRYSDFLAHMYGNEPNKWSDKLEGYDRLRVITNAMTRMRLCTLQGEMEFSYTGEPEAAPKPYLPWFAIPNRASRDIPIVCGHWSALGLQNQPNLLALDTGCLWGKALTAVRLDDRKLFQVSCPAFVNLADWK